MASPRAAGYVEWKDAPPHSPSVVMERPSPRTGPVVLNFPWDFPPGSPGAAAAKPPRVFLEKLRTIDPRMTVTFQPVTKHWIIWRFSDRGEWVCVCPVCDPDTKERWPLDNRILGILYFSDPKTYGGARAMWLAVRSEIMRQEQYQKDTALDAIVEAKRDADRHVKIRTGYGYSPGNKAAMHSEGRDSKPLPKDYRL